MGNSLKDIILQRADRHRKTAEYLRDLETYKSEDMTRVVRCKLCRHGGGRPRKHPETNACRITPENYCGYGEL